ncbi:hypothetical protein Leryth_002132 [Lithospermum erythrorhizon]|nr:hypothetical protein Leryth_002132 [Lithospermum erythrorhizon]
MDARISLVEQKLDILVNSSGSFGLQHGTRVSAPLGSLVPSSIWAHSLISIQGNAPQMSELKESDTDSTDSCKQSDGITAPDLDCSEDDEDGNVYTLENSDVLVSSGDKSYTPENDVVYAGTQSENPCRLQHHELPVSSVVDLEFPILEVKFDPHGSSMTRSPLEALLYDVSNIHIRTCSVGSLDEAEFTSDDGSRADDLPTDYNLLGDMRFDDIEEVSKFC